MNTPVVKQNRHALSLFNELSASNLNLPKLISKFITDKLQYYFRVAVHVPIAIPELENVPDIEL